MVILKSNVRKSFFEDEVQKKKGIISKEKKKEKRV